MNQSGDRIPTLDGWRGIAILMVILTHFQAGMLHHPIAGQPWMFLGTHGVTIFFVLSGYLITSRLLLEDRINLRSFYVRRFFRLMPAAWAYLACLVFLGYLTHLNTIGSDLWACLFFFRNYLHPAEIPSSSATLHFWSLSIEEQFYLLWPPLLLLLGRKYAVMFATLAAIACAAFKYIHWSAYNHDFYYLRTEVRADSMLVGCLLAFALAHPFVQQWFVRFGAPLFYLCLPIFAWQIVHFQYLVPFSENIVIALLLACTSLAPQSLAGRILQWQHLAFTGQISYSLYLWQNLFLRSAWGSFGYFLLPLFGIGSWLILEKPLMRFGKSLSAHWDSRSRVLATATTGLTQ
ncbi:MAG TPA: acyltransferase [Terracidiphilus sp.]|jgi:peptidoglycan/LPS O-acetylase OafA/YrhL|nr:acyltransferase [Terracidiphilus sp.]